MHLRKPRLQIALRTRQLLPKSDAFLSPWLELAGSLSQEGSLEGRGESAMREYAYGFGSSVESCRNTLKLS